MLQQDFQCFVELNARALVSGDFDAFRSQMAVPMVLVSADRVQLTLTEDLLRQRFTAIHATFRRFGVTDVMRPAYAVLSYGGGLYSGFYDTHAIAGTQRVLPVFTSQMILREEEDRRRCVAIISGLRQDHDFWKNIPTGPDEDMPA